MKRTDAQSASSNNKDRASKAVLVQGTRTLDACAQPLEDRGGEDANNLDEKIQIEDEKLQLEDK